MTFRLEVEDGWPPVASESLPFERGPDGYQALVAPLFVKDLSAFDIIHIRLDEEGRVEEWRHSKRSGHSTVWLLRMEKTDAIHAALAQLRELGCATVTLDDAGAYSVDVPESVSMDGVDAILNELDSDAVAAAFPSFRHPE